MKSRRAAILTRREAEAESQRNPLRSNDSPMSPAEPSRANGRPTTSVEQSQSPPVGFTAVNNVRQSVGEGDKRQPEPIKTSLPPAAEDPFAAPSTGKVTYINGRSIKGASPTERAEMMKQFMSASEREQAAAGSEHARRSSIGAPMPAPPSIPPETRPRSDSLEILASNALKQNISTVAIPGTPASLLPALKPNVFDKDDGGPFKLSMVTRMESMQRGERVIPPCDRCRRLHMDCLKNLTACMGCTKKHAKCSWKDVKNEEIEEAEKLDAERQPEPQPQSLPSSPVGAPATVAEVTRAVEDGRPPDAAGAIATAPEATSPTVAPVTVTSPESRPPKAVTPPIQQVRPTVAAPPAAPALPAVPALPPAPAARPDQAERAPSTPRFDVRPPPLTQGPLHENRRSPPHHQPAPYHSPFAAKEYPRHIEDENDEGDRLEALARSTYRSYSQSVRSPEH